MDKLQIIFVLGFIILILFFLWSLIDSIPTSKTENEKEETQINNQFEQFNLNDVNQNNVDDIGYNQKLKLADYFLKTFLKNYTTTTSAESQYAQIKDYLTQNALSRYTPSGDSGYSTNSNSEKEISNKPVYVIEAVNITNYFSLTSDENTLNTVSFYTKVLNINNIKSANNEIIKLKIIFDTKENKWLVDEIIEQTFLN